MSKIVVAYRDNRTYRKLVPVIVASLEALGFTVQTVVAPLGTEKSQLQDWILENRAALSSGTLLLDGTLLMLLLKWSNYLNFTLGQVLQTVGSRLLGIEVPESADELNPWNPEDELPGLALERELVLGLIEKLPTTRPKGVVVVAQVFGDHSPKLWEIHQKTPAPGNRSRATVDREYAILVASWFEEAGVPSSVVERGRDLSPEQVDGLKNGDLVLIYDRHLPLPQMKELGATSQLQAAEDWGEWAELAEEISELGLPFPVGDLVAAAGEKWALDYAEAPTLVREYLREQIGQEE